MVSSCSMWGLFALLVALIVVSVQGQCNCSTHGYCDEIQKVCVCDDGFKGANCTLCFNGTYPLCVVTYKGHQYQLMDKDVDFLEALTLANEAGGYLASITSLEENEFIRKSFFSLSFWIGGADSYVSNSVNGTGYFQWQSGPDRMQIFYDQNKDECVYGMYCNMTKPSTAISNWGTLFTNKGVWSAELFTYRAFYLVEYGADQGIVVIQPAVIFFPYNKHYYQIVNNPLAYEAAWNASQNITIQREKGYLATITTPQEFNFIIQNYIKYNSSALWLGAANAPGDIWTWDSPDSFIMYTQSTPVNFTAWSNYQPQFSAMFQKKYLSWDLSSGWRATDGTLTLNSLVEYECTRDGICNGHGECSATGTPCLCDVGYTGAYCSLCVEAASRFPACYITNNATGHKYLMIGGTHDYYTAFQASISSYPINAVQGYMATITSAAESQFLRQTFPNKTFWLAGNDAKGQGTWSWQAGPEKPYIFYTVNSSVIDGMYSNFDNSKVPTGRLPSAVVFDTSTGLWIAARLNATKYSYLVEFGGSYIYYQRPNFTTYYNPSNKHFYRYIGSSVTWNQATAAAVSSTFNNSQGYLMTVTSPQEHNWVFSKFGFVNFYVLLGATEQNEIGTWRWVKERNTFFVNGVCTDFCIFGINEPNNLNGKEHALTWRMTVTNVMENWNDFNADTVTDQLTYIIEYDCTREQTCSNRGDCVAPDGTCKCDNGFSGDFCNITAPCQCSVGDICCGEDCRFLPASANVLCRNSSAVCDAPEYCSGKSATCPPDIGKDPSFICRPNVTVCDIPEACGQSRLNCPEDVIKVPDACGVCGGDGTACTNAGSCGDKLCNQAIGENCTSCVLDCGHCVVPNPCANVNCVHGTCAGGLCQCNSGWTGPLCDKEIVPIQPGLNNDTKPGVSLDDGTRNTTGGTKVSFSISITKIQEVNSTGGVVNEYIFSTSNVTGEENSNNGTTIFTYKQVLFNRAYIVFSFFIFDKPTTIHFANQSSLLSANTLKSTVQIFDWPFESYKNTLKLYTTIEAKGVGDCDAFVTKTDTSDTINWLQYKVNGVVLYAEFMNRAEVDGGTVPLVVTADSATKSVLFHLPHFWKFAIIDPNYSFLVDFDDSDTCRDDDLGGNKKYKWPVIISAIVVGAILTAGALVLTHKKLRKKRAMQRLRRDQNDAL